MWNPFRGVRKDASTKSAKGLLDKLTKKTSKEGMTDSSQRTAQESSLGQNETTPQDTTDKAVKAFRNRLKKLEQTAYNEGHAHGAAEFDQVTHNVFVLQREIEDLLLERSRLDERDEAQQAEIERLLLRQALVGEDFARLSVENARLCGRLFQLGAEDDHPQQSPTPEPLDSKCLELLDELAEGNNKALRILRDTKALMNALPGTASQSEQALINCINNVSKAEAEDDKHGYINDNKLDDTACNPSVQHKQFTNPAPNIDFTKSLSPASMSTRETKAKRKRGKQRRK